MHFLSVNRLQILFVAANHGGYTEIVSKHLTGAVSPETP